MEYNGPNNSYYVPAFVMFDAGLSFGVSHGVKLQVTAQNLSNVNFNTYLGNGLYYAGTAAITQGYANGKYIYGEAYQAIEAAPFTDDQVQPQQTLLAVAVPRSGRRVAKNGRLGRER